MSSSAINEKQTLAYVCFPQVALVDVHFSVVVGSDEQLFAFYLAVNNGLSKNKTMGAKPCHHIRPIF